jgi:asparagine synthetase B (glutamine-hydrolysing)
MKKENKNNYYNDEDKVNFEKLNNFNKFNSNNIKNTQLNNYNTRYSNSDKNYFNTILKIDENTSMLNNNNINKEKKYYNTSDFKKFDQLNNFAEYNDKIDFENKENLGTETKYKSSDYGEFNKIIQTKNNEKKNKDHNKKIKVITYDSIAKK